MAINTAWIERFKVSTARLEEWTKEAGPTEDLLRWCLLNGKISERDYLDWACRHYELPIVEPNYFQLPPDTDLWEKVYAESQWSAHLIPVHEWEGVLLIACVEPVELKLKRPHRFVLAPASSLNFLWTSLGHSDVAQAPKLTPAPAPAVELPDGFAVTADMPQGIGEQTPSLEFEMSAAPAPIEAPAGLNFSLDTVAGKNSDLGDDSALDAADAEADVDASANAESEDAPLEISLDLGQMPATLSFDLVKETPPAVFEETQPGVEQTQPGVEVTASGLNEIPPPLSVDSKPAFELPPMPKLEAKPSIPAPALSTATTAAPVKPPPQPVKPATPPPKAPPVSATATSSATTTSNIGIPVPMPALKRETPAPTQAPAVKVNHAPTPAANVKSVDIPQTEDTPLPSRPGVTDFHQCYTFEEATDLAFSQMKGLFQKGIMLVFQGGQLRPWKWTGNVQYAGRGKASYIDLSTPSIFRIPYNTSLPYHGYVVPNEINNEFFKEFNGSVLPKHVTIMPLKVSGNIAGMLMGITDEKIDLRHSLRQMEGIAENVSQAFSRIRSHKIAG